MADRACGAHGAGGTQEAGGARELAGGGQRSRRGGVRFPDRPQRAVALLAPERHRPGVDLGVVQQVHRDPGRLRLGVEAGGQRGAHPGPALGRADPGEQVVGHRLGPGQRGDPARVGRALGVQHADRLPVPLGQPDPGLGHGQRGLGFGPQRVRGPGPVDHLAEMRVVADDQVLQADHRVQVGRSGPADLQARGQLGHPVRWLARQPETGRAEPHRDHRQRLKPVVEQGSDPFDVPAGPGHHSRGVLLVHARLEGHVVAPGGQQLVQRFGHVLAPDAGGELKPARRAPAHLQRPRGARPVAAAPDGRGGVRRAGREPFTVGRSRDGRHRQQRVQGLPPLRDLGDDQFVRVTVRRCHDRLRCCLDPL